MLLVLTGKTTSGKDTVMAKLLQRFPDLKRVVTTTSRTLRIGEKDGVDYNFISKEDFGKKIAAGEFIEHVEYGGNLYGTEKAAIVNNLNNGLIWRIDPSRAGQIREFIRNSFDQSLADDLLKRVVVIYLTVDDEIVLERLKRRGISQEEIERRMQEDRQVWQKYKDNYDFVVENITGKLKETVEKIADIVKNHHSL